MNMNELTDYYPTPKELADKMAQLFKKDAFKNKYRKLQFLEPSAGDGNLVDALNERFGESWQHSHGIAIDCIEPSADFRTILNSKKNALAVYDDFLSFHTSKKYDAVIMNPPFSEGAKHLLKAIEVMQYGGQIVCILNAETIRNPYTNERSILVKKLSDLNAEISYIENAFISAERKTGVEIALIYLNLPGKSITGSLLENMKREEDMRISSNPELKALVSNNKIAAAIERCNFEIKAGIKIYEEYLALEPLFINDLNEDNRYAKPIISLKCFGDDFDINSYIVAIRRKYWSEFFRNEELMSRLTSNLRDEFSAMVDELKYCDFNFFNINEIRLKMANAMNLGLEETILNLFEKLSYAHSWYPETSNNIHYYNGWATNKAHKINEKKVILPGYNVIYDSSWRNESFDTYQAYKILADIEKTLNYLDDGRILDVNLSSTLEYYSRNGITKKIPLKYFYVTFYKKGTCHIEFYKETKCLIERLNIYGSQKKGWLPPSYGKKGYSDMTDEEKSVVDEFQGEKEYEKVLRESEFYLAQIASPLLIAG